MSKPYNFDGEKLSFTLKSPVEVDGIIIREVSLRDLTVGESIELEDAHGSKGQQHQDAALFARMADKPIEFVLKMKHKDFKRMRNYYWETLGNVDWEPSDSE